MRSSSCDSYNTAQLQLLSDAHSSGDTVVHGADGTPVAVDDTDVLLPEALEANMRGRTSTIGEQRRRLATSTSAVESLSQPAYGRTVLRRTRSISVTAMNRIIIPGDLGDGSDSDAMDTGSDEDDVDFWGGESPRDRKLQARLQRDNDAMMESGDESERDDNDDENMTDESEDEDAEDDYMEIYGHR